MQTKLSETTTCPKCGLMMAPGDEHPPVDAECITQLRRAMQKQRQVGETMAFEISVRYFAILEELAKNPGADIAFMVTVPCDPPMQYRVEPLQVAGIYAAILKRYGELGDWTPLHDARAQVSALRNRLEQAKLMLEKAEASLPAGPWREAIADFLRPLEGRPRDPAGS